MNLSRSRSSSKMRYFVPDLTPQARPEARGFVPRVVFVGESPHVQEVTPEAERERRPLCGMAGRQWWSLLGELLEDNPGAGVGLDEVLAFCKRNGIAVINAVQYPIDPKIVAHFKDADPLRIVGFSKAAGPTSYKRMKGSPKVLAAIQALRLRLEHPALKGLPVHALGNDAEWFVRQALGPGSPRIGERVPHPSAWWRQGGLFGRLAREKLRRILC